MKKLAQKSSSNSGSQDANSGAFKITDMKKNGRFPSSIVKKGFVPTINKSNRGIN